MKLISFRRFVIVCLSLFFIPFLVSAQTTISILGDSYSTFLGHVTPASNAIWYGEVNAGDNHSKNNVHQLEQTWWYLLINKMNAKLECNNSYSGSTICLSGYKDTDYSDRAFIARIHNLGNPDIIFIFGGTNDAWASSPIGNYQYEKWTRQDLFYFRPAFAYLLNQLTMLYPKALICNISNCNISSAILESMQVICSHYGVKNIQLENIEKQSGHPSIDGMRAISDQVYNAVQ